MKPFLIVWIINLTSPQFFHKAYTYKNDQVNLGIYGCIVAPLIGCEERERYFQEYNWR